MVDRTPFVPEAWEVRQMLRQRQLLREGFTECTVDLVGHRIVAKANHRIESLDDKPAAPPLTVKPS